jgi:D-psicose/D-tagatose/L-ribulose 3-epimerase
MSSLCISALAWDIQDEPDILPILKKHSIHHIEGIPWRIWSQKKFLLPEEFKVQAFQALLYGFDSQNFQLFGDSFQRQKLMDHLFDILKVAHDLKIRSCIFGSPKNRSYDSSILSSKDATVIALKFFKELGDRIQGFDSFLCLEPNPTIYGCNFLTTTEETLEFLHELNHEKILLNLDLGAVTQNNEDIHHLLSQVKNRLGHVHISEPGLMPISQNPLHLEYAKHLKNFDFSGVISIEMKKLSEPLKELPSLLSWILKTYN